MSGDIFDGNSANTEHDLMQSNRKTESNDSAQRTAILRVRKTPDLERLHADIKSMGVTIVSEGTGVIVIQAPGAIIEKLRKHNNILAIEEPRQLQMRGPVNTSD